MSRSDYDDSIDDVLRLGRWRGAVRSATKGSRGQSLLRDTATALDAMPAKELITGKLVTKDGRCCALGAVARHRGVSVANIDPKDYEAVASALNVAAPLVREIAFENDEGVYYCEDVFSRWERMREWVAQQITPEPSP